MTEDNNLLEEIREMAGEWTVSVSGPGFLNWLNARLGRAEAERDAAIDRAEAAEAERDEWEEKAEETEKELCLFMDDLIAIVGDQVIVADEVKFSAIVEAVAALRDRAKAAEAERDDLREQLAAHEWRPGSEPPEDDGDYLGWDGDELAVVTYWSEYEDSETDWSWTDRSGDDFVATHWRPFPAPPNDHASSDT